jgi:hypothetical protein
MGTWFLCARPPGTKFPPASKSIDPASRACRGRRQRSFVRAVVRTTCYLVSGLGWTAMSRRSRPTQSLGLILSSIGVGFRQRAFL